MSSSDLEKLHAAVESLLRQESFSQAVELLKSELSRSQEPFVWSTVALDTLGVPLPSHIKSCWIFYLKRDVPSGCHYHPNSVQHMIALNGHGRSKVGGVERTMIPFGSTRDPIEEKWYVIGEGVPHEFFPEGEDMTVVSFHTCEAAELEEIAWGSGASRIYEPSGRQTNDAQTEDDDLLAAEHAVMRAIQKKDRSALERLLAPEFVLRLPGSGAVDRDGFVAMVLAVPGRIESIRGHDTAATVLRDVGVVTGIQEAYVHLDEGGTATSRTAFTDVFRRDGEGWRLVLACSVDLSTGGPAPLG